MAPIITFDVEKTAEISKQGDSAWVSSPCTGTGVDADSDVDFTGQDRRDATESEQDELPRVADSLALPVLLVILVGGAERFTYYAITTPWQNYIQNARESTELPGALGLGQSMATGINNGFGFFSSLMPLPFALVSDLYLGRYKTLLWGLSFYIIGCLIQFVTSLPVALDHGAGAPGLGVAMFLVGLGQGAVKASFSPLLGDQYDQDQPQTVRQKNGELAVTDKTLTLQLIFNFYYWVTNIAALSAIPSTFLERICGFWTAYLMAFASLGIAILALVLGRNRIVRVAPQGNNLPRIVRIFRVAAKRGFRLDAAKGQQEWPDWFVDEVKQGLLVCRLLLCFSVFYLGVGQIFNNLVSQAGQMELHGVPNDMITAFSGVACVLMGPVVQAMYSLLARRRIRMGPITRIALAFFLNGGAMAYAAGIQELIYRSGPCYDHPLSLDCPGSKGGTVPNAVNIWLQTPVYFIFAAAEIFGFVTASEYTYKWAPKDARTVVQAFTQLSGVLGSVIAIVISPAAKDPDLVVFYAVLAAVMVVSALLIWVAFRKYNRDEWDKSH